MYCSKCGKETMDEAVICPNCGCPIAGKSFSVSDADDTPNAGLDILGFFIPLVGLILFCCMIGKTPKKAKQIGIFSIVGFFVNLLLLLII